MINDLLTAPEVAERMTVSVRTVWRWTREGVLPRPIRIGGVTRWRRRDIDSYIRGLAEHTVKDLGVSVP